MPASAERPGHALSSELLPSTVVGIFFDSYLQLLEIKVTEKIMLMWQNLRSEEQRDTAVSTLELQMNLVWFALPISVMPERLDQNCDFF